MLVRLTEAQDTLSKEALLSRPVGLLWRGWRRDRGGKDYWIKGGPIPSEDRIGLQFRGWNLTCRVFALSAEEFRRTSGRAGGTGWIVDSEVYWTSPSAPDDTRWVWHHESRAATEEEASALVERLKSWIDRRSLRTLMDQPKAGPLSMSKLPRD